MLSTTANERATLARMRNNSSKFLFGIRLASVLLVICSSCSQSNARKYFNAGSKKSALGDYAGAISDFDKAIHIDPGYIKAYNNRGLSKDALNDEAGAIADYNKAIELNPQYQFAYYNRANAEQKLKDYASAIRDADKAIA